jgi:hypothetical protein
MAKFSGFLASSIQALGVSHLRKLKIGANNFSEGNF